MSDMEDRLVRVGPKPIANYLMAVAIKFRQGHPEVILSGYGKQIAKAHALSRLCTDLGLVIKSIDSTSVTLPTREGKREVSGIYITLTKKG